MGRLNPLTYRVKQNLEGVIHKLALGQVHFALISHLLNDLRLVVVMGNRYHFFKYAVIILFDEFSLSTALRLALRSGQHIQLSALCFSF